MEVKEEQLNCIKDNKDKESENIFNFDDSNILTNDSYTSLGGYTYSFCVFRSIDNILSLLYTKNNSKTDFSIVYYNLIDKTKILEIKNAHNSYINNYRHILDELNQRDLIISISTKSNNIKLWNINNCECLLDLINVNTRGLLNSASFIKDNNNIYIISSNCVWMDTIPDSIKVFDLEGNIIKKINDSNNITFFVDSYYDKKWSNNYIITGNSGSVIVYDFFTNKIYRKYSEENDKMSHLCVIVKDNEEITKLLDSCSDGNVKIWHFHTGELLQKINVCNGQIYGICLWNKEFLLVGSDKSNIILVEISTGKIKKKFFGHYKKVVSIQKIIHSKFGECLISQGSGNDIIKIWKNNEIII